MNIESIITEWFYRLPKGYANPPYTDQEVKVLRDILLERNIDLPALEEVEEVVAALEEELGEDVLTEQSANYDDLIIDALNVEEIPQAQGNYQVPTDSKLLKVDGRDMEIWKKLYKVAPDKSVGDGEIALYWLFQYQKNSIPTSDNRGGNQPDLRIGDKMVEVKSYPSYKGKKSLGRFSSYKEELNIFNTTIGFRALVNVLNLKGKDLPKVITAVNFHGRELQEAFEVLLQFRDNAQIKELAEEFEIFKQIYKTIEEVDSFLENPKDAEDAASKVLMSLMFKMLGNKPGDGNYMAFVTEKGDVMFYLIDRSKLSPENIVANIEAANSFIHVNYHNLFT